MTEELTPQLFLRIAGKARFAVETQCPWRLDELDNIFRETLDCIMEGKEECFTGEDVLALVSPDLKLPEEEL